MFDTEKQRWLQNYIYIYIGTDIYIQTTQSQVGIQAKKCHLPEDIFVGIASDNADNGQSPVWRHVITKTNPYLFLINLLGTNFNEI